MTKEQAYAIARAIRTAREEFQPLASEPELAGACVHAQAALDTAATLLAAELLHCVPNFNRRDFLERCGMNGQGKWK